MTYKRRTWVSRWWRYWCRCTYSNFQPTFSCALYIINMYLNAILSIFGYIHSYAFQFQTAYTVGILYIESWRWFSNRNAHRHWQPTYMWWTRIGTGTYYFADRDISAGQHYICIYLYLSKYGYIATIYARNAPHLYIYIIHIDIEDI